MACLGLVLSQAQAQAQVRGRVVVDDAMPPATPIQVELRCPGAPPMRAEADERGRFTLQADADDGCMVTASLPGYAPDSIPANRLPLDPEIGGLALRREGKWQGYALSSTTLAASDAAVAAFADGVRALRAEPPSMARAEQAFARAAEADPQFAEAWFQLARLRLARSDLAGARQAFKATAAADPWYISPYRPLLMLDLAEERWSAARALCDRWLRLAPHLADVRYYRAVAALELGDLPGARVDLQAIESGPEAESFALVHHLRGRILEREGELPAALAEYRRYLALETRGPAAAESRARLAQEGAP